MRFLFLHGSWHGAWCWHKVLPFVQAEGHQAIAMDLPGRGRSPGMAALISLETMVRSAAAALTLTEKTTIVVHSRSGIVASRLAELRPDQVQQIVYLAAFMLPAGKRVLDYLPDKGSLLNGQVEVNRAGLWDRLQPAAYRDALYSDCSDADIELAKALLAPEPLRPALTRLALSSQNYGSVSKAYIRLRQDKAVSLDLQDRLLGETPVERVESLDTSHSAYFSQPEALARTVLKLAGA